MKSKILSLFDLQENELFIWLLRPNEVFHLISYEEDKNGNINNAFVKVVLRKDSMGIWRITDKEQIQNFNPYAQVQRMQIQVED